MAGKTLLTIALWLVGCAFVCPHSMAEPTGRYVWPLKGYDDISGAFCDWRSRHYHGGIDLSVEGRVGLPIRAADSGWVMRVSTSYWGYGKALYLKLSDGRIAVYGHLDRFTDAVEQYVESEQYAAKRYKQNLFPASHQFPVARGEIVAYSGQTGTGPPHLHFEIRTGDNKPLNPLRYAFDAEDDIAPQVESITVVPRAPSDPNQPPVIVNGSLVPVTIPFRNSAASRSLSETPVVSGPVGIAILAQDHISGKQWTKSPYRHALYVNGELVSEIAYDSINYDQTKLIDLERRYDPNPGYQPRPVAMYRLPGNDLWHYTIMQDNGWLVPGQTLVNGTNSVRIEVDDAAGNRQTAEFGLILTDKAADNVAIRPIPSTNRDALWCKAVEGDLIVAAKAENATPICYLDANARTRLSEITVGEWQFSRLTAANAVDTVWIQNDSGPLTPQPVGWSPISFDNGGVCISEDGAARIRFGVEALYTPAFVSIERLDKQVSGAESPLYQVLPEGLPIAREATLSLSCDKVSNDPKGLGVYRYRGSRGWSFEGADSRSQSMLVSASITSTGIFALRRDLDPPVIRSVKPGRGVRTKSRRPTIRFEMFDAMSGMGSDADVIMTIDDQWVPVEYEPDTRRARARPRWNLTPGKHRVEIKVTDQLGNTQEFLRILNIVR